jgi:D-arabinose 1-dehydrogenase-like Zn-dependent alcohol dehydrogenase
MPLTEYLSLLRPGGHFVTVGAPEADSIPQISAFVFIMGRSFPSIIAVARMNHD